MNSKEIAKKDFAFSYQTRNFFSLGRWLFQKVKFPYLVYLLLVFLNCYFWALIPFNIHTNFNQKNPNYGCFNWIFWQQNLNLGHNSQWYLQLILILLLSFFLGVFLFDIVGSLLKDYCIELNKSWLRKLIIHHCSQLSPETVKVHQAKINQVIFYDVSRFSFHFVNLPSEIFRNLTVISFSIYFLLFFLNSLNIGRELKALTLWFNLIVILAFLFYMFLAAGLQKQKDWEKKQRTYAEKQQIQLTLTSLTWQNNQEEKQQKQARITKTFRLLDHNLNKNRFYFLQTIIFNLPILIIPGLSVIFYFLYYRFAANDFSDAFLVYLLSLSIQSIFWKFRKIFQLTHDYHKASLNYNELKQLLANLVNK
ncbi:hypothetical protein [endosymbiont GvMRE of Glomus versiforme]|uniref:hypothetical protein n=1 Tax=endosymbiont GvMRE of Glomus versiforme TaxID=2039283 RepID=UPI000EC18D6B|nr:hypothetical protein [endosymbiont GvMRE of Glomus versiforme]RHZ36849.1 hypothetical protein GvMRE_I2g588 [endosymbiont GvMRE of Glomus versiforme]